MTKATTATMAMAGLFLALAGCGSSGNATGTGGSGATGTGGSGATGGTGGAGGAHPGSGGEGGGAGTTCAMITGLSGGTTGTIGWKDNGTQECANRALADRTPGTTVDRIEIDGVTETGTAVDLTLSSDSGPLGGTYTCQPGNGTTAPSVALLAGSASAGGSPASDCSVTITFTVDSAGTEHAQGTFSGTVTGDGGTHVITDGTFDLVVAILGG